MACQSTPWKWLKDRNSFIKFHINPNEKVTMIKMHTSLLQPLAPLTFSQTKHCVCSGDESFMHRF